MTTSARRTPGTALLLAAALVAHLFMATHGHAAESPSHAAPTAHAGSEEAGTAADMLSFCFTMFVAFGVGVRLWRQLVAVVRKAVADCRIALQPVVLAAVPSANSGLVSPVDAGVLLRV
jgi:hypothetical protein